MDEAQRVEEASTISMLAIVSLMFGILAWTLLPLMGLALASLNVMNFVAFPLAGAVIASVCARLALKKIRVSGGSTARCRPGQGGPGAGLYTIWRGVPAAFVHHVTSLPSHALAGPA